LTPRSPRRVMRSAWRRRAAGGDMRPQVSRTTAEERRLIVDQALHFFGGLSKMLEILTNGVT